MTEICSGLNSPRLQLLQGRGDDRRSVSGWPWTERVPSINTAANSKVWNDGVIGTVSNATQFSNKSFPRTAALFQVRSSRRSHLAWCLQPHALAKAEVLPAGAIASVVPTVSWLGRSRPSIQSSDRRG